MLSETEAREKILGETAALPKRAVPLGEALNCFAAEDYFARIPLPAFDNSAMDGYALVAASVVAGQPLRVTGEQPAGPDRKLHLRAGEAIRIFTGAPVPAGADAVVMQEDVRREGDQIFINELVRAGEFVRTRGCDLAEGQQIVAHGDRIRATTAALLASQGVGEVQVGGQVDAAIISTGDELVSLNSKAGPGQIYNSNSVLLDALLRQAGAAIAFAQHCRDRKEELSQAMSRAAAHRVLVLTGGVSVGAHDLVQEVLRSLGAKIEIWRVAVKPGKPFLFGRLGDCAVFGLPGNPVSAFVTFLKFVRPALLKLRGAGAHELNLTRVALKLAVDLENEGERPHYFRGTCADGEFAPIGRQESHALFGLSRANALLRVEAGAALKAGAMVAVEIWD